MNGSYSSEQAPSTTDAKGSGFVEWISPTLTRLRRRAELPSRDSRRQRDEPSPTKILADG